MKQKQYSPLTVGEMAVSLFAANEGLLDDVEVKKIVEFEAAMHGYVRQHYKALLEKINASGDYDKDIEAELRKAITDFKSTGAY